MLLTKVMYLCIICPMKNVLKIAVFLILLGGIIIPANDAYAAIPVWNQISDKTVKVGELLQFSIFASDQDTNNLGYYALGLPLGATFDRDSRVFRWTPDQTGFYAVTFRVFDGFNTYSDMDVNIKVVNSLPATGVTGNTNPPVTYPPVYQPPVFSLNNPPIDFINFNPPTLARESQLYFYTVQAYSQGNQITYRAVIGPDGLTIDRNSGTISWVPNYSQGRPEAYLVTIGVSNGFWESQKTFYITVEDVRFTPLPITNGPMAPTVEVPDEDIIEEEDNSGRGFMAGVFGILGAFFLSPLFLLLIILILIILLYLCAKKRALLEQELRLKDQYDKKNGQQ